MNDDELWSVEEKLWTNGADQYERTLDAQCVMAFPAPAGIMLGRKIVESLEGAPRWTSVTMGERHLVRPMPDVTILAYRARGTRDGAPAYEAYCTSTYRRASDGWRLVQHQQTPL
jgi:hypothetical protein